jgi:cell division cycle 20, cofactor of APC complex
MSHTNISIFQVSSQKILSVYSRTGRNCFISALSFNKLTAELVVSYNYKRESSFFFLSLLLFLLCMQSLTAYYGLSYYTDKLNEILVLGSMDRVVDLLKSHEDIVYYMLWSPDGKKLATVGNDESLVLWNFFGNSKRLHKRNKRPERPKKSPFNQFLTSIR